MSSGSRVTVRSVGGGGGVAIAYRVHEPHGVDDVVGSSRPTLLLVHGWAQDSRSWGDDALARLTARHRVIAMDVRGHGASQCPDGPGGWTGSAFAEDVAAVLRAESPADGVVLCGWSYGGLVLCDHLARARGSDATGPDVLGLVLVGAITSLGRGRAGGTVGSAMRVALPDAASPDPRTALRGMRALGTALVPADRTDLGPISQHFFGMSLATPPAARSGLFARSVDHDDLLRSCRCPF